MYGLKEIGDNQFECDNCKEIVQSGIFNISDHWVKCAGKEFHESIISLRIEKVALTLDDVEILKRK